MLTPSQLSATVDMQLLDLVQGSRPSAVDHPRTPPSPMASAGPRAERLRTKLVTALLALSSLLLGAVFWLALH